MPIERRRSRSGKVSYRVRIRRQGLAEISATFDRASDARDFERKASADALLRRYMGTAAVRWTVAEMVAAFVDAGKLEDYSPSHRVKRVGHLRFWSDTIGDLYARSIDPPALSSALRRLGVSGATQNRYLSALSRVYRWAISQGLLDANPAQGVERAPEPAKMLRWLRDDERIALLDACQRSRSRRLYPLVRLAIATGGRRDTELMRLDWRDVDLDRHLVTFPTSKNHSARSLPIDPETEVALVALGPAVSGKVFARGRYLYWPRKPWEFAVVQAEIEPLRFHDLRHTFGSYLARSGATPREIAEAMGHRTLSMAMRYCHLAETHTQAVVSRMQQRMRTDTEDDQGDGVAN